MGYKSEITYFDCLLIKLPLQKLGGILGNITADKEVKMATLNIHSERVMSLYRVGLCDKTFVIQESDNIIYLGY